MKIKKSALLLIFFVYGILIFAQREQLSFITINNDTLHTRVNSIMAVAPSHSEGFLLINNQRYYISQLEYAFSDLGYYKVLKLNDEGRLEVAPRIEDGRYIDLYARKVYFKKDNTSPQWSIPTMKSDYLDSDELGYLKLNYGNIKKAVKNYAPSMEVMKPVKSLQVLEGIAIGASFALLIQDGIRVFNNPDLKPSAATFAVPLALLIPLATKDIKRKKYREAIRLYNRL